MKSVELKRTISECCNDVTFMYNGLPSGITSEVHDYMPTFIAWHGDNTKTYQKVDDVMMDKFYDGKSLNDLAEHVTFECS